MKFRTFPNNNNWQWITLSINGYQDELIEKFTFDSGPEQDI